MIVYRIYSKKNNKSYIGQSVNEFNVRYKGGKWWKYTHNEMLKNYINKYGIDEFEIEILENNVESIDRLNELESMYANKFNSYNPFGYNIKGCGDNKFVDEEMKRHLSSFRLGKNYTPKNKKSSKFKGVYWRESKKSWMCRFHNRVINKSKYTNSEIEAAETFDKVSLFLLGVDCFLNFEKKRKEYLESNLSHFYENFICIKKSRVDGYLKDNSVLLKKIEPLIWEMSIPKISEKILVSQRKIQWCIKKNNLKSPGKNYWQKNKK